MWKTFRAGLSSKYGNAKVNAAFKKYTDGILDDSILGKALDAGEKIYDKVSATIISGYGVASRDDLEEKNYNGEQVNISLSWKYNPIKGGTFNLMGTYLRRKHSTDCCKVLLRVKGTWGLDTSGSIINTSKSSMKYKLNSNF